MGRHTVMRDPTSLGRSTALPVPATTRSSASMSGGTVYFLDLDHQVVQRLPGAVDQVLMPLVGMRRDAEFIEWYSADR